METKDDNHVCELNYTDYLMDPEDDIYRDLIDLNKLFHDILKCSESKLSEWKLMSKDSYRWNPPFTYLIRSKQDTRLKIKYWNHCLIDVNLRENTPFVFFFPNVCVFETVPKSTLEYKELTVCSSLWEWMYDRVLDDCYYGTRYTHGQAGSINMYPYTDKGENIKGSEDDS